MSKEVAKISMNAFVRRLQHVIPKLIEVVNDREILSTVWGKLIPYELQPYQGRSSKGHIVRPDIVWTDKGFKIVELDFVPSGRGFLISGLAGYERKEFLDSFYLWYTSMNSFSPIVYGYGSNDVSLVPEMKYFAEQYNELFEYPHMLVKAVDQAEELHPKALVDRLFYRSELVASLPDNLELITAEPYLDSKMVLAMVHDLSLRPIFERHMSLQEWNFLRASIPRAFPLRQIRYEMPGMVRELKASKEVRKRWVLKSGEVESDHTWGSRSTVPLGNYSDLEVAGYFEGSKNTVGKKTVGSQERALLQEFHQSRDLSEFWNGIVDGRYSVCADLYELEKNQDPCTRQPAKQHIYGRLGVFFLINNCRCPEQIKSSYASYGVMTLRPDKIAHGAKNALAMPFKIV